MSSQQDNAPGTSRRTLVLDPEGFGAFIAPELAVGAEFRDGWRLTTLDGAGPPATRVVLSFVRPDGAAAVLHVERRDASRPAYRRTPSLDVSHAGAAEPAVLELCGAFAEWLAAREPPALEVLAPARAPPPAFDLAAPALVGTYAPVPDPLLRVGIIGGGTAGWLTALALRRVRPELEVTLVESSAIPIIGVGEATTPPLLEFLHGLLEIDERELYEQVQPTWKLGIRFLWGLPGDHAFNFPFVGLRLLDAYAHGSGHDAQGLGALLMSRRRAPVLRAEGGAHSLLRQTGYAYHLDNRRFVRFLQDLGERRGIRRLDCTIAEAIAAPDRGRLERLITGDGRRLEFDLYVDCTGFRSLLLGGALGSPILSYAGSLFNDTAIAAGVPHHGEIAPYTLAETMEAGWCWSIPHLEENHRGYVFSSAFLDPDDALRELQEKNPGLHDPWTVKFRSGRHREWWKGNVVAMGNAYAFVEPLESTAIHQLVQQIRLLLEAFPASRSWTAGQPLLNRTVGAQWDALRGFLAAHFKFNRKLDNAYWRATRAEVDLAEGRLLVESFREAAPLHWRPDAALLQTELGGHSFYALLGYDTVLLGQQVPTNLLRSPTPPAEWRRWYEGTALPLAERALPHPEALGAYRTLLERGEGEW